MPLIPHFFSDYIFILLPAPFTPPSFPFHIKKIGLHKGKEDLKVSLTIPGKCKPDNILQLTFSG